MALKVGRNRKRHAAFTIAQYQRFYRLPQEQKTKIQNNTLDIAT